MGKVNSIFAEQVTVNNQRAKSKKKILLIVREKHLEVVSKYILNRIGFEVCVTNDFYLAYGKIKEAIEKNIPFDLIIVDVEMPCSDGLDLIDKLSVENIKISVIALTDSDYSMSMLELILRGCDSKIKKPFQPEELVEQISYVFKE